MKKYKKPIIDTTESWTADALMINTSINDGNGNTVPGPADGGASGGGPGDAKFRDEEMEDEALMQLLIEQEIGNTSNLW